MTHGLIRKHQLGKWYVESEFLVKCSPIYLHLRSQLPLCHTVRAQVDVKYERHLKRFISLQELKQNFNTPGNPLANVALFRLARLSVSPLTTAEFDFIMSLENTASPAATTAMSPPTAAAAVASASASSAKRRKTAK